MLLHHKQYIIFRKLDTLNSLWRKNIIYYVIAFLERKEGNDTFISPEIADP